MEYTSSKLKIQSTYNASCIIIIIFLNNILCIILDIAAGGGVILFRISYKIKNTKNLWQLLQVAKMSIMQEIYFSKHVICSGFGIYEACSTPC